MGKYSEAIPLYTKVISSVSSSEPLLVEMAESNLADAYAHLGNLPVAFGYAFSSLSKARQMEDQEGVAWIKSILSRLYLKKGMVDSAILYARQGLETAKETGTIEFMRDNANALANAYAFKKDCSNALLLLISEFVMLSRKLINSKW